jgi:hypothetical protein
MVMMSSSSPVQLFAQKQDSCVPRLELALKGSQVTGTLLQSTTKIVLSQVFTYLFIGAKMILLPRTQQAGSPC